MIPSAASLARTIADLGHLDIRDVEVALAYALRDIQDPNGSSRVQWCRHFPWLKGTLSEMQGHRCCWCGCRMNEDGDDRRFWPTFEHIVPLTIGGEDSPDNLAIACAGCNHGRLEGSLAGPTERWTPYSKFFDQAKKEWRAAQIVLANGGLLGTVTIIPPPKLRPPGSPQRATRRP